jgi:hypothetical protein
MEPKPRSNTTNALYFGILTGAAMIVYSLILFIADAYMINGLNYIGYLLLIGGMIWGTLEYRKKYSGGFLPFGKAFSSCFMIGLFAGILASVYMFIFAQFIHPGLSGEILERSREQILARSPDITDDQLQQALLWTKRFTTPIMMMIWGFIMYVIASLIFGLILAIFLRKEDKSLNAPM